MSNIDDSMIEKLRDFYEKDEIARAFLDISAQRINNQTETKVDRTLDLLSNNGNTLSRGQVISLFRRLEEIGCGQFVSGRKGWASRFVWRVGMAEIGRAAAGEKQQIEEIPSELNEEETVTESLLQSDTLRHSYYLRADLVVNFDLPTDLTLIEAERLSAFIKTLPLDV